MPTVPGSPGILSSAAAELLSLPAVLAVTLTELDSGFVLDAVVAERARLETEAVAAAQTEVMRAAALLRLVLRGDADEVVVRQGAALLHLIRPVPDSVGRGLVLSVLVAGPERNVRKVRRFLDRIAPAALVPPRPRAAGPASAGTAGTAPVPAGPPPVVPSPAGVPAGTLSAAAPARGPAAEPDPAPAPVSAGNWPASWPAAPGPVTPGPVTTGDGAFAPEPRTSGPEDRALASWPGALAPEPGSRTAEPGPAPVEPGPAPAREPDAASDRQPDAAPDREPDSGTGDPGPDPAGPPPGEDLDPERTDPRLSAVDWFAPVVPGNVPPPRRIVL